LSLTLIFLFFANDQCGLSRVPRRGSEPRKGSQEPWNCASSCKAPKFRPYHKREMVTGGEGRSITELEPEPGASTVLALNYRYQLYSIAGPSGLRSTAIPPSQRAWLTIGHERQDSLRPVRIRSPTSTLQCRSPRPASLVDAAQAFSRYDVDAHRDRIGYSSPLSHYIPHSSFPIPAASHWLDDRAYARAPPRPSALHVMRIFSICGRRWTHGHTIVIMIMPTTKSPLVSRRRRARGGGKERRREGCLNPLRPVPPYSGFIGRKGAGGRGGVPSALCAAGSDAPEGKVARRCGCAAVDAHGDRRNPAESTPEGGGWGLVKGRGETAAGSSPLCARTQSGRGWDGRAVRGGGRNALRQEEAGGGMRWGEQRRRARSTPRLHYLLITHRAINLNMLPSKSPCDSVGNCGRGIAHDTTSPSPPVFQPFP
ncbi:hypothetical protein K438DRAFT_2101372, partial [Mycena galopus ATCC 62051]